MSAARGGLAWLGLAAVLVLVDQLTKLAALAWLEPLRPVPLTPFANLTLAFNSGAAFSLLGDASGWQRWLFIGLAIAVSVGIAVWLLRSRAASGLEKLAFTLVLGGAVGNVIDRVYRGVVVDFVDLHAGGHHWPVFNFADTVICCGVAALLWHAVRGGSTQGAGGPEDADRNGTG